MFKLNSPIVKDTSRESMIRAIENSLCAYPHFLSRLPGAVLHDREDLLWIASGVPIYFYNGVFRSRFPSSSDLRRLVDHVIAEYEKRKLSFIWQLGPSSHPANLDQHLVAAGFQFDETEPGMALDMDAFEAEDMPMPADFTIKKAVDEEMLKDWVRVWAFGAPDYIALTQQVHLQLGWGEPCHYFIGYLNGKPAATVMLFLAAGVAAIHHVVTQPEARNRGIGTAMTAYALKEAKRAGYRIAILTASEEGLAIYKRLGFQPYCSIHKYVYHVKD
ncbi:GNAT family N-acetyltransferase [Paenibacillus sp. NEAU-GSW1]|uniref:GNAT family N-acetyltransferase n=1 Tax=Paenibacillus sp. NEAU-GSW1 TaxID=2682486 RepID=UPI0012E183AC|nr:GNAT family N-acetyltransferase [Paenibacillus sp. NEAU-GSW1]MUT64715.1 GNAT family N-acetyltransferase [Paenibacillus sp. NEAU-GSW1]